MKVKISKRLMSMFMSVVMVFGLITVGNVTGLAAESFDTEGNRIQNDYLQFAANGEAYAMYTTGGNPALESDNYKRLLYGQMSGGTSLTVIGIGSVGDDEEVRTQTDYIYNPSRTALNADGDCVYSLEVIDDVKIERYCSFVKNTETDREDTLEMKYVITNMSSDPKEVGTRIMFDTMLGDNDNAPFRIYENNELVDVTGEREYVGDDIPQHWYVFDSLSSPTVLASGTFYNNEYEKPDKVQFIYWPDASNSNFYNSISGKRFGDSAVNVYYYPTALNAGESRTVKTYYGLSEFTPVVGDEEAEIRLTNAIAPVTLAEQEDQMDYQSNPFQFSAWISNTGDAVSPDVTATLVLPEELVVDDQELTIPLNNITAGSYKSVAWMIRALPQAIEKDVTYSVVVSVDGEEDLTYDFTLHLPALNPVVHTHTPGEWVVGTMPTCTEPGSRTRYCEVCGELLETEEIRALGHIYDGMTLPGGEIELEKADIAFVIDTTGSMGDEIDEVKENLNSYLDVLTENGIDYRVALIDYRDFADRTGYDGDYSYDVKLDFTNDVDAIRSAINSLSIGDGGDGRETIYSALVDGLTSLTWREDAGRAALVMCDADALDPEPYTGYTREYVRSVLCGGAAHNGVTFETPVSVFGIVNSSHLDYLSELTELTGGEYYTFSSAPGITEIINTIITKITDTIFIPGSDWVTDFEATCTNPGQRHRDCIRPGCGYRDTRAIPALGHDFSVFLRTVNPTYTSEGYDVYKCVRCLETINTNFVPALDRPEEIPSDAMVRISNEEVSRPGAEVTVSFTLKDAPDIKTIMLYDLVYDTSALEIVRGSCKLKGTSIADWNGSEAVMTLPDNADANGLIFELTFRVITNDNFSSVVSCSAAMTQKQADSEDVPVQVGVIDGSVSFFNGDISDDGVLNTLDVIYLLKHTVLPERYPIYIDADFDGDGFVTSDDAIYLLSHLMFPERYPLGGRH